MKYTHAAKYQPGMQSFTECIIQYISCSSITKQNTENYTMNFYGTFWNQTVYYVLKITY